MNSTSKLQKFILNAVYAILPAIAIVFLCNSNDAAFQVDKDFEIAKAVLAFMIYVALVKKVQLFNWASLAVTVILIPVHYIHRSQFLLNEDLLKTFDIYIWSQWLVLMVIIDYIRTFDRKMLKQIHIPTAVFYLVMYLAMWFCGLGRKEPNVLIFPILLYILIPLAKEERDNLIYRLCDSWALAFAYIMIRSFIENPEISNRWYGSFVNLGAFSIFMGGVFAASIFRYLKIRENYGRKSKQYIIGIFWVLLSCLCAVLINTRTILAGIMFILVFLFIFYFTQEKPEKRKKRGLLTGTVAAIGVIGLTITVFLLRNVDSMKWWRITWKQGGIKGRFALIVARFASMWEDTTSFDSGILKPKTIINALDLLSSGRITLWKVFLDHSGLVGTTGEGYQVGTYYAYTAHNAYVHFIYIYGFIGGIIMIAWFIYGLVTVFRRWNRKQTNENLFSMLFILVNMGMMLGEVQTYYYAAIFFALISFKCIFFKEDAENIATSSYKRFFGNIPPEEKAYEELATEDAEYVYILFEEEN